MLLQVSPNVFESKDIERDGATFSSFTCLLSSGTSFEFSPASFALFACSHLSNHSFCKNTSVQIIPPHVRYLVSVFAFERTNFTCRRSTLKHSCVGKCQKLECQLHSAMIPHIDDRQTLEIINGLHFIPRWTTSAAIRQPRRNHQDIVE